MKHYVSRSHFFNISPNGLNHMDPTELQKAYPIRTKVRQPTIYSDGNAVMREQLEYLIEAAWSGSCDERDRNRYLRARAILLEIFA